MWKKRKRDSQFNRRGKQEEEDDGDEDDEEIDDDEEPNTVQEPVSLDLPRSNCESEVLLDGGDRISSFPLALRRTVSRPHSSVMAISALERVLHFGDANQQQPTGVVVLENISYGQVQALSSVPSDSAASPPMDQDRSDGGAAAAVLLSPPSIMEGRGVVKRFGGDLHVLPVHAEWFSEASVHRLERQVVPHFFSGRYAEHTPEKYMDLRNWIVGRYMEDKGRRLAISDLGWADGGGVDGDDLVRVFRFLDHWGIINYCASYKCREPVWSMETYLREDINWEVHVPSAALKSIDSLIHFDKPKCRFKASEVHPSPPHRVDASDIDDKIREKLSEYRCSHCFRPISVVYYQSQKEVDTLLCSDCFCEGRLVIGHSSLDFVKTETTKEHGDIYGENWTDQETLLLLEAMEIYNDNWNEIAEHVGTKSKPQCILHFIRMPMEGGLFENIHVPVVSTGTEDSTQIKDYAGSSHEPDSEGRIPFENSGNPVMHLVAFLTSVVGPRVAAACAHASLLVLSEQEELTSPQDTKDGSELGNRLNLENVGGSCDEEFASLNQHKDPGYLHKNDGESKSPSISLDKVKAAAKAGLSAAAMKAKLFSDHEEREIQRLSANIVNNQLKRMEMKLKRFTEVEALLLKESEQVERARLRFSAERLHIMSNRFGIPGLRKPYAPSQIPGRPHQIPFGGGPRFSSVGPPPGLMFNATGPPGPPNMKGGHPLRPVSSTTLGLT